jgi:hypothetical protein
MGGVVTLTEMSNAQVAPTFVIVIVFVAIWATFRFIRYPVCFVGQFSLSNLVNNDDVIILAATIV